MKYSKGYKYMIEETFYIMTPVKPNIEISTWYAGLKTSGLLTVKLGFAYDGASGPTIRTDNTMQPTAEHDVFYKLMRKGLIGLSWKPIIDKFLHARLIESGMCKFRADYWLKGVKIGSDGAAKKPRKIYEV